MFHVHSAVAWMTPEAKSTLYFKYSMKVSGMVAPVFMFLAGISMMLVYDKLLSQGIELSSIRRRLFRRGLQILAMGYGLHALFFLLSGHWTYWLRIFKVDILHCIGLSMMCASRICLPKPDRRINLPALALFLGAPVLSMILYRAPVDSLPTPIAAYFSTTTKLSLFPIIPYGAWLGLGLFIAPFFLHGQHSNRSMRRFWIGIALCAVAMWFAGKGAKSLYYSLHLDRLGTEVPQVKGVLHFFLKKGAFVLLLFLVFGLTAPLFDRIKKRYLVRFGKTSLFAYALHLAIVYPFFGSVFRRSLTIHTHIVATLAITVIMFGAVVAYEHFDFPTLIARSRR